MQTDPISNGLKAATITDQNGHTLDVLEIENSFCQATIAYQGAQILRFYSKTQEKELLWCSQHNVFKAKKAIRGGIPLCFPWFGANETNPDLPAHGFARNQMWQLDSVHHVDQGHTLTFVLVDNSETRAHWDHAFRAELVIQLGEQLKLSLNITNQDASPITFTFAWHSYFAITDIQHVKISGLEHTLFIDKLVSHTNTQSEEYPIVFTKELDRIYLQTKENYIIQQATTNIKINSAQCQNAVVWNPWQEKTLRLGDLAIEDWRKFVCLECGNVGEAKQILATGQTKSYHMTLSLTV